MTINYPSEENEREKRQKRWMRLIKKRRSKRLTQAGCGGVFIPRALKGKK